MLDPGGEDRVALFRIPPSLDGDIAIILTEGDHFLRGGHLLSRKGPPVDLTDDLAGG